MLAVPLTPDTEEMHAKAAAALRVLKHYQGAWLAMQSLKQAETLMAPDDARRDRDTLKRISNATDEAIDHLLDVLEPDCTRLMLTITSLQAEVRERLEAL